jgi:hypothetical protein
MSRGTGVSLEALTRLLVGGGELRNGLALDHPVGCELGSGQINGHVGTRLTDSPHDSGTDVLAFSELMAAFATICDSMFGRFQFWTNMNHDLSRD